MKYKFLFFAISLFVIIPGIFSLAKYGLKLSIDFTGGTLLEIKNEKVENRNLASIGTVQKTSSNSYIVRTKPMGVKEKNKIIADLEKTYGKIEVERFETVGPTVGKELTIKAIQAVAVASVVIILYIAYAFREIPKPYSPWKFGASAVVALLHDVLVVVGVFSILGHFLNVEVDALFVTALLTVIGFSVHDTIVVFDRVRENLRKMIKTPFEEVVNVSILQTLVRSINTSLTALIMMGAIIIFGGESIKWFAIALFIGIFSGTYSSIFNAAPLLVVWEEKRSK
ncbi:MAG: protein translocase subunit SecF [Patescibacteria group bacterium]